MVAPRKLDRDAYAGEESWYGSYYELAIEISLSPADAQLAAAHAALWESPRLQGPWEDHTAVGKVVELRLPAPGGGQSWYGILTVEEFGELPCRSGIIREVDDRADWLDLSIPVQALVDRGLADLVHEAPLEFLAPIDRVLVEIGVHVYARAGFLLAAIGEETSGMHSSESFGASTGAIDSFLVPRPLWKRVENIDSSKEVASGLRWISARRVVR